MQANPSTLILPADIHRLRSAFGSATRDPNAFGHAFYARVFELAPAARALFPADLDALQQKLVHTLQLLLKGLDRPESVRVHLQLLGARHVGYGAEPAHYGVVAQALIDTIGSHAGQPLEEAERAALGRFLGWVAETMLEGAQRAQRKSRVAAGSDHPTVPMPLPRLPAAADRP